jgi:hypothetical protein
MKQLRLPALSALIICCLNLLSVRAQDDTDVRKEIRLSMRGLLKLMISKT